MPELGSRRFPVRILISSHKSWQKSATDRMTIEKCLDQNGGFRAEFAPVSGDQAVISSLKMSEAPYGFVYALKALEAERAGAVRIQFLTLPSAQSTEASAFVVPMDSVWQRFEQPPKNSDALIAYTSPNSDFGFVLPRYELSRLPISIGQAVFAGSAAEVVSLVTQKLVTLGVVPLKDLIQLGALSENKFTGPNGNDLKILKVTSPQAAVALASSWDMAPDEGKRFNMGFELCLRDERVRKAFEGLVGSGSFRPRIENDLKWMEQIVRIQENHPRILSLR